MIQFFCRYCGLLLTFKVDSLKLDNFNYTCPLCKTFAEVDIKMRLRAVEVPPGIIQDLVNML